MRNWLVVFVLVLLAFVFVLGNIITQKGGVLDKAILNKNDPYYQMDQYVKSKSSEGFNPTEFVPFVLKFPNGINLKKALEFNAKLEQEFGDRILSLAQIPDYQDTGEELLDEPYLNGKISDIKNSPYYGIFIGRDFDYLLFSLFLEPGYDEIQEFRRIVEFLEEREISWHEWWHKTDINPKNPNIGVAGWIMGRGLIDLALTVDILTLVTLGLLLTFPIFILSLRSVKQALIATLGVVFMSLIWTRGSIGIMQFFGLEIKERVYVLLAYANCIVQGVSFSLHKFESINQKIKSINWLIGVTALIAIGSFGTLYWFQVLTIRELGIISAIGVGFLFILATVFLPALNALFKGKSKSGKKPGKIIRGFDFVIAKLVNTCLVLSTKLSFAGAITVIFALIILTTSLILNGQLIVRTKPLEFIQDTLVHKTGQYLNKPKRIGFDFVDLLVENKAGIYDPDFIKQAWLFQQDLKQLPKARETSSILNAIAEISQESFKKPLPTKQEELFECFFLLENSQIGSLQEQFWYDNGIRISVSTKADDSNELGEFCDQAIALSKKYPELKVSAFGKISAYPRVDRYIRLGKPWNIINSQWVVILFCFILILWQNRKIKSVLKLSAFWGSIIMSAPFIFASAVMALIMIVFKIPLDIVTAAITALAINASIDFSIYFVAAYQEGLEKTKDKIKAISFAMQDKGKVIIEDMILNSICFAPLLTSHFLPVKRLGWVMTIMLLACGFGALVIMPALLPKAVKGGAQDDKIAVCADAAPAN